jgi:flavorubredoxin
MFAAIENYTAEFRQSLYNASSKSANGYAFSKLNDDVQDFHIAQINDARKSNQFVMANEKQFLIDFENAEKAQREAMKAMARK